MVRLEELVVGDGPDVWLSFHERLTVVCGLSPVQRLAVAVTLQHALDGTDDDTFVRYRDDVGRSLEVYGVDGLPSISLNVGADRSAPSLPLPQSEEVLQLVNVTAADMGTLPDEELPDPDTVMERLIGFLALARHGGHGGTPAVAILDEPLADQPARLVWDLLDLLERVSEQGQIVYLTGDAYVTAWARRRAEAGAIGLLTATKHPGRRKTDREPPGLKLRQLGPETGDPLAHPLTGSPLPPDRRDGRPDGQPDGWPDDQPDGWPDDRSDGWPDDRGHDPAGGGTDRGGSEGRDGEVTGGEPDDTPPI